MKNDLYITRHYLPVIITMRDGQVKDETDTIKVTFLYLNGDVCILSMESKMDSCNVNLPPYIIQNIVKRIKEKALTT